MKRQGASNGNGGIFNNFSGFYYYTQKICDLMIVSILWLLGCLPVITAGTSFAALYDAASRSIRRDYSSVGKRFWKSYKRNFKASIPVFFGCALAIFLLLLGYGIARERIPGLPGLFFQMLYLFCALLAIAAANYAVAALSRFDMPFSWIMKLSLYLTFRHLPRTALLILLFLAAYFVLMLNMLTVVIVPGLYALLAGMLIDPLLDRHMPEGYEEEAGE